ncbi:hypothetical protein ACIRPX_10040 [Streptomyces sp. NPDC101225]|uniref:hypothetical protein n=1 Tax=Streptomyces sp. NPDC101225 TaxID=3366135 RepID=UPI0038024C25
MDAQHERFRIEFAGGTAASVANRRSFRDHERNDIEAELPGWPPGRPFAVRGFFGRLGRHTRTVVGGPLMLPLHIIAALFNSPSSPDRRGRLEERENEVDDFPVMWAARGETARTLPWQLDPSRRPWRTVTELELADSDGCVRITSYEDTARGNRFFGWGGGGRVPGSEAVLWEVPRHDVAGAEVKPFSMNESDVKIRFRDGSWARLTTTGSSAARKVVGLLDRS